MSLPYEPKKETKPEPSSPAWMKRVPLLTGGLAALAGYLTVRGSGLSNEAIYQSNQAVLRQTQASDKWSEYQADSVKARVVETSLDTLAATASAESRQRLTAALDDLRKRQPSLQAAAAALEHERDDLLVGGQRRLAEKGIDDYAGVAAQLAIALASVAALTRRPAAFTAGVVAGLAAVVMTGYALLMHFLAR
jgi:hypothetical protein